MTIHVLLNAYCAPCFSSGRGRTLGFQAFIHVTHSSVVLWRPYTVPPRGSSVGAHGGLVIRC